MSNSRDLLKEAIADAKSVKEAAIANAKAALEEAFTPYLQEKFAAKLAEIEMEEGDIEEAEMTDENYGMDDSMEENINLTDFPDKAGEHGNVAGKNVMEKDEIDELNLDELLAELDEDKMETEGMEEKTEESLNEAEEEEEIKMDSEEEVEGEDEEIDLEDMSEEDLKALIEDVIADMVAAGELEAGDNFEEEGDEEEEINIDMEDEESEEETMDELLKEEEVNEIVDPISVMIATVASLLGAAGGGAAIMNKVEKMAAENPGGKADKVYQFLTSIGKQAAQSGDKTVKEMEDQIEELASTLSEVKLLNAKLLYTNKIFRAKNLNETQKVKVLEAFDKAASVKEAKLIYETLTTVKETKTAVTESMRGMASKAIGVAPEKKPILEVNDQFARWQILAGIKRN
jgi:hypothetical protein